jgi:hypothetical protein
MITLKQAKTTPTAFQFRFHTHVSIHYWVTYAVEKEKKRTVRIQFLEMILKRAIHTNV